MARGSTSVFAEDSGDDDSLNTTSTPESDGGYDKEYDVETILAEQMGTDGKMHYLLKWEGYPLYRCTWERKDNIMTEILLRDWENDKRLAKQGKKILFDVDEFDLAVEQQLEAQERKKRLRHAKRRRRGEVLPSPSEAESDDRDDLPTTETPKRTRVKTSPVKRKGRAQPIVKKRRKSNVALDEDDGSPDEVQSSGVDSLFGEREESTAASTLTRKKANAASPTSVQRTQLPLHPSNSETLNKGPSSAQPRTVPSFSKETASTGAARKSAPSTSTNAYPTAKRSLASNVFRGDWTQEKKRKQRAWVSGDTPKDSADPKFRNLSEQNRYQKYSKNEPAPDPNALMMIDPKTGKVQPRSNTEKKPGPTEIHRAYGRRTPPPASKARSPTPRSPEVLRRSEAQVRAEPPPLATSVALDQTFANPHTAGRPPIDARKNLTCKFWLSGNCRYTADTCPYAHRRTETEKKKSTTCYYWYYGRRCVKTARHCEFAHEDTGEIAGPPGSFRRKSMAADAPLYIKESDLNLMRDQSYMNDEAILPTFEPTLAPPDQTYTGVFAGPSSSIEDGEVIATSPVAEIVSDPRLRGRTLLATNTVTSKTVETDVENIPAKIVEPEPDLPDFGPMEDPEEPVRGSPEADYEMAKRGIRELDSMRLIGTTDRKVKEVEHVYIHMPDRPMEMKLLCRYFEGLKRKVFTSDAINAWDYFCKQYSSCCLVVVHPSELFDGTIPNLQILLTQNPMYTRVFSIGVQYEQCIREGREPAYEAQVLFPHGKLTFITDDIFTYYPEKATEIIETFLNDTKDKAPGAERSKIGARPGVRNWLLRLVLKMYEEQGGEGECTDLRWAECYEAICRLLSAKG